MSAGSPLREEHILVCISPSPNNARVIEAGRVLARAFGAKLTALYVEPPTGAAGEPALLRQLESNRKLAEKGGAEQAVSYGADVALQIAEFAKTARVTKIVLGHASTTSGMFPQRHDLSFRLTKLLPNMELYLVPARRMRARRARDPQLNAPRVAYSSPSGGNDAVGCAAPARFHRSAHHRCISRRAATRSGRTAYYTVSSLVLSVLTFNYCFTDPVYLLAYAPAIR